MINHWLNKTQIGVVPQQIGSTTKIPPMVRSALATILSIDPGTVIDMSMECSNSVGDKTFGARFPCKIGWNSYIINVTGQLSALYNSEIIGRKNPLSRNDIHTFLVFSRHDFQEESIVFSLYDVADKKLVSPSKMNQDAWKELRNRIPATHPLSLIPQR
jgi:hypothetical protein